jgi:energy-coupling factor transporter transmembrane protein EcfT
VLYKGYPQPWRTWLLILTALIVALLIVQIVTDTGWVLIVVIFALIAIQFGLARYARRQS